MDDIQSSADTKKLIHGQPIARETASRFIGSTNRSRTKVGTPRTRHAPRRAAAWVGRAGRAGARPTVLMRLSAVISGFRFYIIGTGSNPF